LYPENISPAPWFSFEYSDTAFPHSFPLGLSFNAFPTEQSLSALTDCNNPIADTDNIPVAIMVNRLLVYETLFWILSCIKSKIQKS